MVLIKEYRICMPLTVDEVSANVLYERDVLAAERGRRLVHWVRRRANGRPFSRPFSFVSSMASARTPRWPFLCVLHVSIFPTGPVVCIRIVSPLLGRGGRTWPPPIRGPLMVFVQHMRLVHSVQQGGFSYTLLVGLLPIVSGKWFTGKRCL